jgi:2-oxoglutarate ferredoxin oxidoreductase subunit alpha
MTTTMQEHGNPMSEFTVLIGGKAGEGINVAGSTIARILTRCGYHTYINYDYPSLIRGGHNFSLIRAAEKPVYTHRDRVDFLCALNQDCIAKHTDRITDGTVIVYDANAVKAGNGVGVDLFRIFTEEKAPHITRNAGIIAMFCRAAGIPWAVFEEVLRKSIPRQVEVNLRVAQRAWDGAREVRPIPQKEPLPHPVLTGNEAIGLGLVAAGLSTYYAYPMTPTSSLLHFLAGAAGEFGITVVHPENEIGVMLMALGAAYAGEKVAVGTSGGGFCLMTEGLSFAGQAELPVVIVMGQRTGPSTGLPTYTAQTELSFVISAGQGEFPRFIVAPADAVEAYAWAAQALRIAHAYQVPAFILTDKTLSEGFYSVDPETFTPVVPVSPTPWDGTGTYRRYAITQDGISPLAFPPVQDQVIKVNSYAHDESGISTEKPDVVRQMMDKSLRKWAALERDLSALEQVRTFGRKDAGTVLLCWGSTRGACAEAGEDLGLRVVQPVVVWPFPAAQLRTALEGATRIIAVENNATAQLATLCARHGIAVTDRILKYDGRSFSIEDLTARVQEVLR